MNDDEIIKKYFDWEETLDNDFEINIGVAKELMIKAREDYIKSEDILREIYSWGSGEINPEFLDILAKRIKKIITRNQSPEKREPENVSGEKGGSNKTIAQDIQDKIPSWWEKELDRLEYELRTHGALFDVLGNYKISCNCKGCINNLAHWTELCECKQQHEKEMQDEK